MSDSKNVNSPDLISQLDIPWSCWDHGRTICLSAAALQKKDACARLSGVIQAITAKQESRLPKKKSRLPHFSCRKALLLLLMLTAILLPGKKPSAPLPAASILLKEEFVLELGTNPSLDPSAYIRSDIPAELCELQSSQIRSRYGFDKDLKGRLLLHTPTGILPAGKYGMVIEHKSTLHPFSILIQDTTPPVFEENQLLTATYPADLNTLLKQIRVSDHSPFLITQNDIDQFSLPGVYSVMFTATDAFNNKSRAVISVQITA